MDGGQDEFVYAGALLVGQRAVGKLLDKPVCATGFVVGGAGIVDHIVGPQGQFQAEWVCGQVSVWIQPSQTGGDVVQGVIVAVGLAVEAGQLVPSGVWLGQ